MTILKDVLYDPDPDGQGSGGSSDGGTPPPAALADDPLADPSADPNNSPDPAQ